MQKDYFPSRAIQIPAKKSPVLSSAKQPSLKLLSCPKRCGGTAGPLAHLLIECFPITKWGGSHHFQCWTVLLSVTLWPLIILQFYEVSHKNGKLIHSFMFFALLITQGNLNANERKPRETIYKDRKSSVRNISHRFIFLKQIFERLIQNNLYSFSDVNVEPTTPIFSLLALSFPLLQPFFFLSYLVLNTETEHTAC